MGVPNVCAIWITEHSSYFPLWVLLIQHYLPSYLVEVCVRCSVLLSTSWHLLHLPLSLPCWTKGVVCCLLTVFTFCPASTIWNLTCLIDNNSHPPNWNFFPCCHIPPLCPCPVLIDMLHNSFTSIEHICLCCNYSPLRHSRVSPTTPSVLFDSLIWSTNSHISQLPSLQLYIRVCWYLAFLSNQ